jgi:heat shock protein HtpX
MSVFLVLIILIGWSFSYIYNSPEILVVAVIFSISMNILGYWFSDKVVLSMSRAKKVERKDHKDLWNVVENLCITAGLPMPNLYIISDDAPNAFATGRNQKHAAVAVTSGLLELLDRSELEGVIAHELSHIGNKDTLISTVIVVLVGFVTLASDFFLRVSVFGGNRDNNNNAGLFLGLVGIVLAILSPIIATVIRLAISRKREFLADSSAAILTRYPEGLASALEKISSHQKPLQRANHAFAHLFIANPFADHQEKQSFLTKIFMTHPPVKERILALRRR